MPQDGTGRWIMRVAALVLGVVALAAAGAQPPAAGAPWVRTAADGSAQIELYFFWSRHCPHCNEARPFIERLPREHAWLALRSLEVSTSRANARLYVELARSLGQ
ncbi:MAG: hypothetical protein HXY24_19225, partial [Rubrivivax sp.]|nr:hypothetical protein [Rubrivivax sp.]